MSDLLDQVESAQTKRTKRQQKAQEKVEKKPKKVTRVRKPKYPEITPEMVPSHHCLVTSWDQLDKLMLALDACLQRDLPVAFDSETKTYFDDPLPKVDQVVGLNFFTPSDGLAWYVPFGHETGEHQLDKDRVIHALRRYFEDPKLKWVGHNLKYDYQVMKESCGVTLANLYFDTIIAAHLLHENDDLSLEYLSTRYLKEGGKAGYQTLFGKTKFSDVPLLVAAWYACKDAEVTFKLYEFQKHHLSRPELSRIADLFWNVEMPLVRIVAEMELVGFRIDIPYLKQIGEEIQTELRQLDKDMRQAFGVDESFNFNSAKQLSELLFEKLKLPNLEDGSTNAKVLEKLAEKHKGVELLLEHRKASKIYGTYVEGLLNHIIDGRIYPSFNQVGTTTGRFSSSNPNFQNLPAKEDRIRKAVIPPDGYLIVSIDFSQIELRVLAALSRDPALLEAYEKGYDLHSQTASLIFGNPYEAYREAEEADNPTEEHRKLQVQRKLAKNANFGIIYGQTAKGFARFHGVPIEEAEQVIQGWFRAYPQAKAYLDRVVKEAYERGYVTTYFGRKRRLHKYVYSGEIELMKYGERQAMNAPIQGTAADILKMAMVKIDPVARSMGAIMVATIHDELMFYVPETITDDDLLVLKRTMETAADIGVPIVCDMEVQTRWGERIKTL